MSDKEDHDWLKQGSTSSGAVQAAYDAWATDYEETLASWNYHAPTKAAELMREALPGAASLLDAGCGTGLAGIALRMAGFTGTIDGFDLSPESLGLAAKHGVYRDLNAVDLQAPPLPIAEDSYDGLLCVGVLTYIPDGKGVLREFARVVRPGGSIVVTQREDLFRERGFAETLAALVDDLDDVTVSEPQPYLPNHPDFGTDIGVHFITMTASGDVKLESRHETG